MPFGIAVVADCLLEHYTFLANMMQAFLRMSSRCMTTLLPPGLAGQTTAAFLSSRSVRRCFRRRMCPEAVVDSTREMALALSSSMSQSALRRSCSDGYAEGDAASGAVGDTDIVRVALRVQRRPVLPHPPGQQQLVGQSPCRGGPGDGGAGRVAFRDEPLGGRHILDEGCMHLQSRWVVQQLRLGVLNAA